MRIFAIVIMLVIGGCRCYGQNSGEYQRCADKAQTQFEQDKCASDEAARADLALNTVYRGLLVQIAGDSLAIAKLRESETA